MNLMLQPHFYENRVLGPYDCGVFNETYRTYREQVADSMKASRKAKRKGGFLNQYRNKNFTVTNNLKRKKSAKKGKKKSGKNQKSSFKESRKRGNMGLFSVDSKSSSKINDSKDTHEKEGSVNAQEELVGIEDLGEKKENAQNDENEGANGETKENEGENVEKYTRKSEDNEVEYLPESEKVTSENESKQLKVEAIEQDKQVSNQINDNLTNNGGEQFKYQIEICPVEEVDEKKVMSVYNEDDSGHNANAENEE